LKMAPCGMNRITIEDFQRMFNARPDEFPQEFRAAFGSINTAYRQPVQEEFEEYVLDIVKMINTGVVARSSDENFRAWEKGWGENLEELVSRGISVENLKPKYFRPNKFLRYNKSLVVTDNLSLEYDLFTLARQILFRKYLSPFDDIYEFGCGSCQNLLMLLHLFPHKKLVGLDWAAPSVEIAKLIAKHHSREIGGISFDMLDPPQEVILKPHSAVFTVHALEQIGNRYEKFLDYLVSSKASMILHYEPILEFYDENNLLDYLALVYSQKRNYLSGFWTALCRLRDQKKIEIIEARRPFLGGMIHEASVIAWRPLIDE